jgi:hypothetical protein
MFGRPGDCFPRALGLSSRLHGTGQPGRRAQQSPGQVLPQELLATSAERFVHFVLPHPWCLRTSAQLTRDRESISANSTLHPQVVDSATKEEWTGEVLRWRQRERMHLPIGVNRVFRSTGQRQWRHWADSVSETAESASDQHREQSDSGLRSRSGFRARIYPVYRFEPCQRTS